EEASSPPVGGGDTRTPRSLARWSGQSLDAIARTNAVLGEPALAHLEGVLRGAGRPVRALVLRLHVLDIDDAAVAPDECDRQRYVGVLHPEALRLRLLEYEDHPVIGLQAEAVHESGLPLFRRRRDLGRELLLADHERGRRQFDDSGRRRGGTGESNRA